MNLMVESFIGSRRNSITRVHADNEKKDHDLERAKISPIAPTDIYDEPENFIFDSVYVHFDLSVFIYQFTMHMLLPFSIWMSPSPKAQLLWWDKDVSYGDMCATGTIYPPPPPPPPPISTDLVPTSS